MEPLIVEMDVSEIHKFYDEVCGEIVLFEDDHQNQSLGPSSSLECINQSSDMVVESNDMNESKGNQSNQSLIVVKDKGVWKTERERKRKERELKQQEFGRKLKQELQIVTGVRKQIAMM